MFDLALWIYHNHDHANQMIDAIKATGWSEETKIDVAVSVARMMQTQITLKDGPQVSMNQVLMLELTAEKFKGKECPLPFFTE